MAIRIRRASESDLAQIHSIYEYYISNTVVAFLINKPPIDYIRSRFEASRERGLPYLVAQKDTSDGTSQIVGYAYASPFRGFMLGYGHSVEMTIFCDQDHTGQGVGSILMGELLRLLRETRHVSREVGYEDQPKEFEIKNVMAIMSVDDEREDKGLGLRDWKDDGLIPYIYNENYESADIRANRAKEEEVQEAYQKSLENMMFAGMHHYPFPLNAVRSWK